MDDINRIMVVSKSTKNCQKAVHYGISLAKRYRADLYVVHFIHNPFGLKGWNLPLAYLPALEEEYRKMIQDAKEDLDSIIQAERTKGIPIEEMVIEGEARKNLFKFIEEKKIDLIIMSAYEQWRIEHLLFGREIDEIVRTMPCSVFLVKKKLHAVPESD